MQQCTNLEPHVDNFKDDRNPGKEIQNLTFRHERAGPQPIMANNNKERVMMKTQLIIQKIIIISKKKQVLVFIPADSDSLRL